MDTKKRMFLAVTLALLLVYILALAFNVQLAQAGGTVYIRADGSIDPPYAPISTSDNITYTLVSNLYTGIVVERDNVVVDGASYTLQGTDIIGSTGVDLTNRNNVTIKNTKISAFSYGIYFWASSNNSVSRNNITNNHYGIRLLSSSNCNIISENHVANNQAGIFFSSSNCNIINLNNITTNKELGIILSSSYDNRFFHNNLINNTQQVYIYPPGCTNIWDDGYPSGGNYWSDYTERYPEAEELDDSGLWDTPYVIDENNQDNYPIISEFPSATLLPLFTILSAIAVVSAKKEHLKKRQP